VKFIKKVKPEPTKKMSSPTGERTIGQVGVGTRCIPGGDK
jgi:hypothetical protein